MKNVLSACALLLFAQASFASTCDWDQVLAAYDSHGEVILQMKGVNVWGAFSDCESDAYCLILGTETKQELSDIQKIFPYGLEINGCKTQFTVGEISAQPIALRQVK